MCVPVLTRGLRERESEWRRREPSVARWGRGRRRKARGEGEEGEETRARGRALTEPLWQSGPPLHCWVGRRAWCTVRNDMLVEPE